MSLIMQMTGESSMSHLLEIVSAAFAAAASAVIPVMIYIASVKRGDREANAKMAAERDRQQNDRHKENQDALAKINNTLAYNPPHIHVEDDEGPSVPLMSGGIRYGPKMR